MPTMKLSSLQKIPQFDKTMQPPKPTHPRLLPSLSSGKLDEYVPVAHNTNSTTTNATNATNATTTTNTNNNTNTPQNLLKHIPIGHPDSMMSKESVRRAAEEFQTKPSDIIVTTFPKTGTTLVAWICHLLRTGAREDESLLLSATATSTTTTITQGGDGCGANDGNDGEGEFKQNEPFETLYEVIPWPMLSWDIGIDPNVHGSQFAPRVFKSHLRMASIYPGSKYVVTVRDPGKTALSFYNFFISKRVPFLVDATTSDVDDKSTTIPTTTATVAESKLLMDVSTFLVDTKFVRGCPETPSSDLRASIWEYYTEYHSLMECPSVLMLIYEDFIGDEETRKESIRTLGKFMGILDNGNKNVKDDMDGKNNADDDDQLIARTAYMSTKAYMSQYMSKFDEPYERAKELNRAADVSQLAHGAKVVLKTHTQTFDDRANRFMENQWKTSMEPLGYSDYDSFVAAVRERNEKLFV